MPVCAYFCFELYVFEVDVMEWYHFSVAQSNDFEMECQDLVDIDVFQEAKRIIDALQNKEVAPALAWCADNKSRLKKSKVMPIINHFLMLTINSINIMKAAWCYLNSRSSSLGCYMFMLGKDYT